MLYLSELKSRVIVGPLNSLAPFLSLTTSTYFNQFHLLNIKHSADQGHICVFTTSDIKNKGYFLKYSTFSATDFIMGVLAMIATSEISDVGSVTCHSSEWQQDQIVAAAARRGSADVNRNCHWFVKAVAAAVWWQWPQLVTDSGIFDVVYECVSACYCSEHQEQLICISPLVLWNMLVYVADLFVIFLSILLKCC